jgi:multidrug efflux pump subunit AcrA (membrane-fusion protein)
MPQQTTSILTLIIVLMLTGCAFLPADGSRTQAQAQQGATPTPIPTPIVPIKPVYEAQRGQVVKTVQFSGRVAPVREEELFFRVSGFVRNVFIERDMLVTQGQLLADLEIDPLERELTTRQLELEQAQRALENAEQAHADALARAKLDLEKAQAKLAQAAREHSYNLDKAALELEMKRLELAKAQNQSPADRLTLAAVELVKARITLRSAQLKYDAIAYADGVGASSEAIELEQATLEFDRAEAAYNLAQKDIENEKYDTEVLAQQVALAELELDYLRQNAVDPDLEQALAQAQLEVTILERGVDPVYKNNVDRMALELAKLEATIGDAQIIAPFDGKILSEVLSAGAEASAFKEVAIIGDLSTLEISADPASSILQELVEGMPVEITLSRRPGETFSGHIRLLPYPYGGGGRTEGIEEEDRDKSTRIVMEVGFAELGLELGDLVQIAAIVESVDDVLWLPPQAIRVFDGREFVVAQDGEAQRRVDVTVGVESRDRVEIKEGLTEGQIVLGP